MSRTLLKSGHTAMENTDRHLCSHGAHLLAVVLMMQNSYLVCKISFSSYEKVGFMDVFTGQVLTEHMQAVIILT